MAELASIRRTLEQYGQQHLLRFHDELPEADRKRLLEQVDAIDLPR